GQVGGYVVTLDLGQAEALGMRPGEEPHCVAVVGRPRVLVRNGVGEEGEKPLGGFVALVGDDGGKDEATGGRCDSASGGGDGQLRVHGRSLSRFRCNSSRVSRIISLASGSSSLMPAS